MRSLPRPLSCRLTLIASGLTLAVLAAAACSDNGTAPKLESIAGPYFLASVAGFPLPVAYGSGTDSLIDDGYTIDVDGSYARSVRERVLVGGQRSTIDFVDSGRVTVLPGSITLKSRTHGWVVTAQISNGRMIVPASPGPVLPGPFIYQRITVAY
ncbi:MAG: hypothetical protein ACJ79K_11225 [Gemmatimonadaceae bacterium]